MKKIHIYIGLVATLLAACENNPFAGSGTGSSVLRIEATVVDAVTTRADQEDIVKSVFMNGDKITVSTGADTYEYSYDDNNWSTDDNLTVPSGGSFSLTATYKPDGEVMSPSTGEFHRFVDELEASATTAGDSPTIVPGDAGFTANLLFTHTNALLNARSVKQAGTNVDPHEITRVAFDIDTNSDGTADYTVGISGTEINLDTDGYIIAPPGTIVNASVTIKYTSGEEYTASGISPTPIAKGMQHSVDFNIAPEGLTMTVSDASPVWEIQQLRDIEIVNGYDHYIKSKADLYKFRDAVNAGETTLKALQLADIDLTGENWTPINTFTGVYNGNGYSISNMKIVHHKVKIADYGFFKKLGPGAIVTGIHLKGVDINSDCAVNAGALAGSAIGDSSNPVVISLCTAQGFVLARENVGGLVGLTRHAHITRCHATVEARRSGYDGDILHNGGLIGQLSDNSYLVASSASGKVSGVKANVTRSGGLVGCSTHANSYIFLCYATGEVSLTGAQISYAGGLIGLLEKGNVIACYATGKVSSRHEYSAFLDLEKFTGALLGKNNKGNFNYCHAIPGNMNTGKRFVGATKDIGASGTNSSDAAKRRATVGTDDSTGRTLSGVRTTEWTGEYGIKVVTRTFKSTDVWTAADPPLIKYKYNGVE